MPRKKQTAFHSPAWRSFNARSQFLGCVKGLFPEVLESLHQLELGSDMTSREQWLQSVRVGAEDEALLVGWGEQWGLLRERWSRGSGSWMEWMLETAARTWWTRKKFGEKIGWYPVPPALEDEVGGGVGNTELRLRAWDPSTGEPEDVYRELMTLAIEQHIEEVKFLRTNCCGWQPESEQTDSLQHLPLLAEYLVRKKSVNQLAEGLKTNGFDVRNRLRKALHATGIPLNIAKYMDLDPGVNRGRPRGRPRKDVVEKVDNCAMKVKQGQRMG